mmetsp:Transcript_18581/g.74672  ORF Transcript_18581/g.74672 Transcript_18581/m.74672 type:complete len:374 (-) Transcript_18581:1706-2827(-)
MYNNQQSGTYRRVGNPLPDSAVKSEDGLLGRAGPLKSDKTAMLKSNTPWKVVAFFFMGLSFLLAMRLSYTLGQESGYIKTSVPGVPGVPHVPGAPGSNVAADPPIPLTPATIPNPLDELRQFAIKPAQVDVEQIKSLPAARRIIVSKKLRIMYCPIPKAANSNWKLLIRKYEGFEDYADLSIANDRAASGFTFLEDLSAAEISGMLNDPDVLKFTFARDPYARTLSCYLNKFGNKDKSGEEYRIYMAQLYGWAWVKQHDIENEERPSFQQFVDQISTQDFAEMNEHWAPQTYLCGVGLFPYDFVGKLEDIATHAPKVIKWMANGRESHFPTQEEIKFSSMGANEQMNQFYNEEIKKKVYQTFSEDFSRLQYAA